MKFQIPDDIKVEEKFEEAFRGMHHCPLCGTKLEFDYEMNYQSLELHEKAHCPSCHIKTKENRHILQ